MLTKSICVKPPADLDAWPCYSKLQWVKVAQTHTPRCLPACIACIARQGQPQHQHWHRQQRSHHLTSSRQGDIPQKFHTTVSAQRRAARAPIVQSGHSPAREAMPCRCPAVEHTDHDTPAPSVRMLAAAVRMETIVGCMRSRQQTQRGRIGCTWRCTSMYCLMRQHLHRHRIEG